MSAMDFQQERIGGVVVVTHPPVKLDDFTLFSASGNLLSGIIDAPETRGVVIDLANVEFAGTPLLSMLVCANIRARKRGKSCAVCCVGDRIAQVMRTVQLHKILTICPTRDEAIDALSAGDDA